MSLHVATLHVFDALRTPLLTEAAVGITALGSVVLAAVVVYTLYHFDLKEEAVVSLFAVGVAGILAKAVKLAVERTRPDEIAVLIANYPETYAFPSGHATLAFALATALEMELEGSNYYFFLLAALVALSRIYLGLHYPGDVVAGALLGLATGYAVHRYRERILGPVRPYI